MATAVKAGRRKAIQLRIARIVHPITLAAETGTLERATWLVAKSCGYGSAKEARENGERLRTAIILTGAINRSGVDCGFDRSTLQFSKAIEDAVHKSTGRVLRASMHGLDVFEENTVMFMASNAIGKVLTSSEVFSKNIEDALIFGAKLSDRQQICASLINDSFFIPNSDVRFVLCVSAVEALCDQRDLSDSYRSLCDELLERLSELAGVESEKKTLSNLLRNQKGQSITQAYKAKITILLGPEKADRFSQMYDLRSKYVHDGLGRGKVGKQFGDVLNIAIELLKADIRAARPTE